MRRLLILAPLLCIAALSSIAQKPATPDDPRFKGMDTAFQRVLDTWHAAGFAVAVVEKNKVIYAKGFGYRDIVAKKPVTANTVFAIGSCTKAFTTALIGILQKQGKVDIDKPVTNYLPALRFYSDAMNNTINLRDMMSHRTGLSRYDLSWYFFNTPSIDSMIQRIQYMEPTAGIREKWQYNNFMYAAQGAVIEKLTGKTWGENIKESLFVPLGMDHSNVSIPEMEKSDEISIGYTLRADNSIKPLPYYHIGGMSPAGAINSNVNDMAKWIMAWINNGRYNGREVIPADFRNEAISSQSILDGSLPSKRNPGIYFSNYGFGWFMDSYEGHYRVEHGGNIDGFTALSSFFPSDSIGIVVLSNQQGSTVPTIVRDLLADRLLNLRYRDWNSERKSAADRAARERDKEQAATVAAAKHNPATHGIADLAGNYYHPAYGIMRFYVKHDSLFASTITRTLWVRHNNYDVFELFEQDPREGIDTSRSFGSTIQFHLDPSTGDVDSFEGYFDGPKPLLFNKQTPSKPVNVP